MLRFSVRPVRKNNSGFDFQERCRMYDFDGINDRRDSNSMKRASVHKRLTAEQRAADPLPMWVTDRSFALLSPLPGSEISWIRARLARLESTELLGLSGIVVSGSY